MVRRGVTRQAVSVLIAGPHDPPGPSRRRGAVSRLQLLAVDEGPALATLRGNSGVTVGEAWCVVVVIAFEADQMGDESDGGWNEKSIGPTDLSYALAESDASERASRIRGNIPPVDSASTMTTSS